MRSCEQILVVDHRGTAVEPIPVLQDGHPDVLVDLRFLSPDDPVVLVGQPATFKRHPLRNPPLPPQKSTHCKAHRSPGRSAPVPRVPAVSPQPPGATPRTPCPAPAARRAPPAPAAERRASEPTAPLPRRFRPWTERGRAWPRSGSKRKGLLPSRPGRSRGAEHRRAPCATCFLGMVPWFSLLPVVAGSR